MKRIIIFITALLLLIACQKQSVPSKDRAFSVVNVGTTANDGTGTPLRTAWQYQNANWLAQADTNGMVRDSLLNKYTKAQTRALINDTVDARLTAATDIDIYLDSIVGIGGTVGMYQLRGIVGTTSGFPANGDSLIINTGFIAHPHIEVNRDELGGMQWFNSGLANNTGTRDSTYVFNSTTGTIIVRPAFTSGERVIVRAFDPIIWHDLIPEGGTGGGGGSGASDLLTNLLGYYKLDETAGTSAVDQLGHSNGSTSATVNQAGKIGMCELFDGETAVISIPYVSDQAISGDTATLSCWVRIGTLPGTVGHEAYLMRATIATSPYETMHLTIGTDNKVHFDVRNTSNTAFTVESSGTLSASTWYHIVAVVGGAGNALKLYLNGSDVSASAGTFTGSIMVNTSYWYIGNAYYAAGSGLAGYIDEVGIWKDDLSSANVTTLYNSGNGRTYPFN